MGNSGIREKKMVRNSQEHAGMDDQLNLINAAADRLQNVAICRGVLKSGCCRAFLSLAYKLQQVGVDLVRVGCGHPVRKTWIDLQRGVLHNLRGHQSRRTDRHDLIVVAVKNESWHIELLQVFSKIR